MENVKIDNSCVYVPIQYEGKVIVIVKKGGDSNNGMQIKKPVRYDENTAWGDHQGKAKCDIEYDIYQWNPRELIGTAKCCGDNYSSSNYSSSSTSTSDNISWWEFGHSDEFFLKSLFLLPFRLIAYAIMIPLSIGFWAISFVYKIIASILLYLYQ